MKKQLRNMVLCHLENIRSKDTSLFTEDIPYVRRVLRSRVLG